MPRFRRVLAGALGVAVIVSALTACAPREQPSPRATGLAVDPASALGLPKLLGIEPVIRPGVRVLTAEELAGVPLVEPVNAADCRRAGEHREPCSYRIEFRELPRDIVADTVLVADVTEATPDGLLVRVSAIDGGTVDAVEAKLGDAVEEGEFLMERQFTPADIRSETLAPGVQVRGTPDGGGAGAPGAPARARSGAPALAFSYAIGVDVVPGVTATGSVAFDLGCGAYGGLSWKKAFGVPVYPNGVHFEASCGVAQEGSITLSAGAGTEIAQTVHVTSFSLTPITFFIGPVPVVLVPEVSIDLTANGRVQASMTVGASEHIGAKAGIRYSGGFSVIKDVGSDFSTTQASGSDRLSLTVGIPFTESLMLYGLVGPSLIETLYLSLEGKPPGEKPLWCLRGGVKAEAALDIDLGIKRLRWGPGGIFDESSELACAENAPPKLGAVNPSSGTIVFPGTTAGMPTFSAQAVDPEDGPLPVAWTSDVDGELGQSTTGKPLKVPGLSLGTHQITATATDADGKSSTATVTVIARSAAPSLAFQAKDVEGSWYGITQASGTTGGTMVVRIVPTSPVVLNLPNCDKVSWSGGLVVTRLAQCDFQVKLATAGSYTLTATLTDGDGFSASRALGVSVAAAPANPVPQFGPITAASSSGALADGANLQPGEYVVMVLEYTNPTASNTKVSYSWSARTTRGSTTGAWAALGTTDPPSLTNSARDWTASSAYSVHDRYDFRVEIRNAANGAIIATRTFSLNYQGPPA